MNPVTHSEHNDDDFLAEVRSGQPTFVRELLEFLLKNKRWWLTPMVIVLLILGLMITATNTAIGPAFYLLF